jgi:O-antigen/teichoic acid export membrane protein
MNTVNRVAFNTFAMYAKVLITVGITLYSTRLILSELGEDDFGAFNLVAGIIGMLAFLSSSISMAAQRYMSYALGMSNKERFFDVCKIVRKLSLSLGVALIVAIEILGFFFLDKLNITPERLFAVQIVFHCTVIATFFSIQAIPYEAAINANEDIFVISIIYIAESFLKLGVAVYLIYSPFDKLIIYSILITIIYFISNVYKKIYCKKYGKSQIRKKTDKKLFFEIARFSSWTAFDPFSRIFSVQGVAVILNIFGGTGVNAAYGIANQVSGQMNYFSTSLLSAINPQIMKSEGMGNRERILKLSAFACKISFFLLIFFSMPLIIEMPYILEIWLKYVPEYTVLFCRLILISLLILQLTYGLQSGILAIGKIRKYQTAIGISKLLIMPVGFYVLKMGAPIYTVVLSFVIVEIINTIIRLQIAERLMKFDLLYFLNHVVFRLLLSFMLAGAISASVLVFMPESFMRLMVATVISSISLLLLLKLLILNKDEYRQAINMVKDVLKKIF